MNGLPILMFHSLDESGSPISLHPARFAEVIRRFLDSGYRGVDLDAWVDEGMPRLERAFAITFDDALATILPGIELLRELELPSAVFVVSERIGRDNAWPGQPSSIPRIRSLSRSELDDLLHKNVTLGAHTQTHPDLTRLSRSAKVAQIRGSQDHVESISGRPCRLFAYPYGRSNREVRRIVSDSFAAAFGTRTATASPFTPRYDIVRIDSCYLRSDEFVDQLIQGRANFSMRRKRFLRACRRCVPVPFARGVR